LKRLPDPQGHRSFRPSFSSSILSPWTVRSPRFTCVSEGNPRRRLLIVSKKRFVLGVLVLTHHAPSFSAGNSAATRPPSDQMVRDVAVRTAAAGDSRIPLGSVNHALVAARRVFKISAPSGVTDPGGLAAVRPGRLRQCLRSALPRHVNQPKRRQNGHPVRIEAEEPEHCWSRRRSEY